MTNVAPANTKSILRKIMDVSMDDFMNKILPEPLKKDYNAEDKTKNVKTAFTNVNRTINTEHDTSNIEQKLHLGTLTRYLPVIVVAVIVLISMVSSELMKFNWPIVTTLIITFLYVSYVHYLSPDRFLTMEEHNTDPKPTLLPIPPDEPSSNDGDYVDTFLRYGIPIIIFVVGIAMGVGSGKMSEKITNYEATNSMIIFGSILLVAGVASGGWWAYKKFLSDGGESSSKFILYTILSFIIGIPLIVRGAEIREETDKVDNSKIMNKENQKKVAEGIADTLLGTGVFFQIAGFMALGYFIWRNTGTKGLINTTVKRIGVAGLITLVIGILASVSLAASQKDKNIGAAELTSFGQKVYLVHGIIWFIAFVGLVITVFGQTEKYEFHNRLRYVLPVIVVVIGFIFSGIQQASELNQTKPDNVEGSAYYQQLRDEAIKEFQKKNPTKKIDVNDPDVRDAIQERLDKDMNKSKTPTSALLWIFTVLAWVIIMIMCFSLKTRIQMADNNDDTLIDNRSEDDNKIKTRIREDKMSSDDWDKVLMKVPDNFFSKLTVRFAKWFSLIPFLSMILLLMWVSVLFTNVTTSAKTSDWIASKFSGDMFPRVKELIDAFFIVLIVGFVLCAIMLLPFVKEMNIGGLESILTFAESVQVWQFNNNNNNNNNDGDKKNENSIRNGVFGAIVAVIVVFFPGLSWWWDYLKKNETDIKNKTKPVVPENWGWAIAFVVLLAVCAIPTGFHLLAGTQQDFQKENILKRILRSILTTVYLVPWFIIVLFRLGLYSVASLTGLPDLEKKRDETIELLMFWKWGTTTGGDNEKYFPDLRLFPLDDSPPKPKDVSSVPAAPAAEAEDAAAAPAAAEDAADAVDPAVSLNETKVNAVGTLIKTLLLTMAFVIVILVVVYYVYKIDAEFVNPGGDAASKASGGIMANLDSPTAHIIYFIITIVGIAGLVAYLREKFKTANNNKNPEDYLFDDMKTEDETKPLRQLAFGATHIIYVILMVIVWVYDRDKDDKSKMSVTGMTVLGIAILLFHYGLEFMDTMKTREPGAAAAAKEEGEEEEEAEKKEAAAAGEKPSVTDLFTNIRFVINTVFFIVLCALAYYKQHGAMVALILAMFIFHLTKSALGVKLLKLLWLGIIYIPCLFLDLIQSSQGAVGDTTRPIWIILAIEILLIAILYGGPYLINYIGASASQIVAAPVSLKEKYDTNLTTQSEQIFIYHNTGMDRTPADDAANCPIEEKKRYNYAISGWFLLNNASSSVNQDLEIFDFGGVPKMTYNSANAELKLKCNIINISTNLPIDANGTEIYNSKTAYNAIIRGKSTDAQTKLRMLQDKEDTDLDVSIPLQKWNYFVVNYNGKTMDLFLNTKLIFKSDFIMPDIQLKPITVGDTTNRKGLNGSVCNFSFHKTPLTKEQIRWTYTMFKSLDPPLISMKTIQDDVKEAGTTVAAELSK